MGRAFRWPGLLIGASVLVAGLIALPKLARRYSAETIEIGRSVQGRPIKAIRVGSGPRIVVVTGAIHGDEFATTALVEKLADAAGSMPGDVSVFFVPLLNPDGQAQGSRYNAHGVDLNRNWDTNNWQSSTAESSDDPPAAGGASPFSEPETAAFSRWLLTLRDQSRGWLCVIMYHCAYPPSGLVQPGYRLVDGRQETNPNAAALAQYWASKVGYTYCPTWPDYPITGEAIHWCAENGIPCIDIELPSASRPTRAEVQLHLSAIVGMVQEGKGGLP
jgi:predicted deacylase